MRPLYKRGINAAAIDTPRFTGMWDNLGNPEQLRKLDTLLRSRLSR